MKSALLAASILSGVKLCDGFSASLSKSMRNHAKVKANIYRSNLDEGDQLHSSMRTPYIIHPLPTAGFYHPPSTMTENLHHHHNPQYHQTLHHNAHYHQSHRGHPLQAVAIGTLSTNPFDYEGLSPYVYRVPADMDAKMIDRDESVVDTNAFLTVLSTAFLVTGNTVGAGSLVLPELAQGLGLGLTSLVFLGCYLLNLVSGLAIAEVAINQYETSGDDVSCSFKEFVQANLMPSASEGNGSVSESEASLAAVAANFISVLSVFVNSCVLAFDFARAGEVGEALLHIDSMTLGVGSAVILALSMATLSAANLSFLTSIFVTALFVSFGGMLLPGLSNVQDPLNTFLAAGNDMSLHNAQHVGPIILMSMIYQNIVPTVAKICDYDRTKTMTSLALGSFFPLAMYEAWCYCALGGGIETSTISAGPLLTVFTLATLAGSAVGTGMSVAEECESFFKQLIPSTATESKKDVVALYDSEENESISEAKENDIYSLPAVLASVGIPAVGYLAFFGQDFTEALKIGGAFGSPLLYGVIPAILAWNQRKAIQSTPKQVMVPGGVLSLGTLGFLSTGYVGEELVSSIGNTFATTTAAATAAVVAAMAM